MKINRKLIPIKLHYFFFMAASGPILPYLTVYGKELGISEVVMGSITAILPIVFLLAKPFFGFLADYFMQQRKLIFMLLILSMSLFYGSLYFIPPVHLAGLQKNIPEASSLSKCDSTIINKTESVQETELYCFETCDSHNGTCQIPVLQILDGNVICRQDDLGNSCSSAPDCNLECILKEDQTVFYQSIEFYGFVAFMSLSMIAFNVGNSISDAICFDILGEDSQNYGNQRVWGAVGFGITALIGGLGMDLFSNEDMKNYMPAFLLVLVFTIADLLCCTKLKLPKTMSSESILKDVAKLLKHRKIIIFLCFTTLAGILDSFIIYFMFWFLEDLASETGETNRIKVLEGLTVAAETLGGEIIFFPLAGKILEKIGYGHSFTICFFNYAVRLGLISLIPSPWWILAIELFMQGPTYALTYTVIVAYANAVAPSGTSATMQGLVAGMDDGLGYAIGSLLGGFLYKATGGRIAFQYFCVVALMCCLAHFLVHKYINNHNTDTTEKISRNKYTFEEPETVKNSDEEVSKL